MGLLSCTGKMISAGFAVGNAMNRGVGNLIDSLKVKRAQRRLSSNRTALASGYLLAGDQAGTDSDGLMDYRGIDLPERIAGGLMSGVVPLGRLRNPRTGVVQNARLPWEVLNTHAAIIAPPGSGKTYGIIVPWILGFVKSGGRVIANDVKGDLLTDILKAKEELGIKGFSITTWNPMDEKRSCRWNPLSEVHDDITRTQLVTAVLGDPAEYKGSDPFFIERDHRWLRGLIKYALGVCPHATFYDIYMLLSSYDNVRDAVDASPGLCVDFADMADYSPGEYSLAISSLLNKLEWFTSKSACRVTKTSDFTLADITEKPGLLLIGSRLSDEDRAKAAAAMMFALLKSTYASRFSASNHLPNAWIIDEAAVIAKRIALDMTLSQVRSYGVGIAMALQDVTQLGNEDKQNRYLSNCKTLITLRNVSDATARYFSKRLGDHMVRKATSSLDQRGRPLPQESTERVPVLGTSEIMHPPLDFGTYCGIVHTPTLGLFCSPVVDTSKPYIVDFSR